MPPPEDFGERCDIDALREWRKARRVRQEDLADVLGVSRWTVMNWEAGRTELPPFLHLALESIDRRLSFRSPAPPPPPKRRGGAAVL